MALRALGGCVVAIAGYSIGRRYLEVAATGHIPPGFEPRPLRSFRAGYPRPRGGASITVGAGCQISVFSTHDSASTAEAGAPPLLILGRMDIVLFWAYPRPIRRLIGQLLRKAVWLRSAIDVLSRPLTVWLLASAALWFWHSAGPYAWAFYNPGIHIFEHLSFFLTSLAFWARVMQPFNPGKTATARLWRCLQLLPWKALCWAHCSPLPPIRFMWRKRNL
ncbi:MAG: cytochrome c oxidase assembly protein [Dehalococcoidia bacterium]|nr:cytochrome c oxidase assembly protein [Dehalococcoidia bacterium]